MLPLIFPKKNKMNQNYPRSIPLSKFNQSAKTSFKNFLKTFCQKKHSLRKTLKPSAKETIRQKNGPSVGPTNRLLHMAVGTHDH